MRRLLQWSAVSWIVMVAAIVAQPDPAVRPAPPQTSSALSVGQQRAFLASARIISWKETSKGVTRPLKVVLSDGTLTHAASFQRVDISKPRVAAPAGVEPRFRDYYGYNIAAHQLACLINRCDLVPATVERLWRGDRGALCWWVDAVVMDEGERLAGGIEPPRQFEWVKQQYLGRVFTELTGDADRNQTNILITQDWRMVLIDFSRAFRLHHEPRPALLAVQGIDADVLEGLRALTGARLGEVAGRWLSSREIAAVLARRDGILAHLDRLIAAKGYAQVVYPVGETARR